MLCKQECDISWDTENEKAVSEAEMEDEGDVLECKVPLWTLSTKQLKSFFSRRPSSSEDSTSPPPRGTDHPLAVGEAYRKWIVSDGFVASLVVENTTNGSVGMEVPCFSNKMFEVSVWEPKAQVVKFVPLQNEDKVNCQSTFLISNEFFSSLVAYLSSEQSESLSVVCLEGADQLPRWIVASDSLSCALKGQPLFHSRLLHNYVDLSSHMNDIKITEPAFLPSVSDDQKEKVGDVFASLPDDRVSLIHGDAHRLFLLRLYDPQLASVIAEAPQLEGEALPLFDLVNSLVEVCRAFEIDLKTEPKKAAHKDELSGDIQDVSTWCTHGNQFLIHSFVVMHRYLSHSRFDLVSLLLSSIIVDMNRFLSATLRPPFSTKEVEQRKVRRKEISHTILFLLSFLRPFLPGLVSIFIAEENHGFDLSSIPLQLPPSLTASRYRFYDIIVASERSSRNPSKAEEVNADSELSV